MAYPTGDHRTSAIGIEKCVPREARAGSPVDYEIVVTNLTANQLDDVLVTDHEQGRRGDLLDVDQMVRQHDAVPAAGICRLRERQVVRGVDPDEAAEKLHGRYFSAPATWRPAT